MVKKLPSAAQRKKDMKKLQKELDVLWSKSIHKIWGEKCGWPGCEYKTSLAAHHYCHKAQGKKARWNLNNGILLDFYHHIQVVHRQGWTEPIRTAIIDKIGLEAFRQMLADVQGAWKPTIEELQDLKQELQERLKGL